MKNKINEKLMSSSFDKLLVLVLMVLGMTGTLQKMMAAQLQFIPQAGYSQVIGSNGSDWKPGYNLGLDIINLKLVDSGGIPLNYGMHVAYNRFQVDSDNMLETGGKEMHIEREKGVKDTWDVTSFARYLSPFLQSKNFRHWLDLGLGVHYICTSAVEVKGFYRFGDTAVNREISRDSITDISPSITFGITAMIAQQVQTSVRYQHYFESGQSSNGTILLSLGMIAR